jgi:hypothetical protein
VLAEQDEGIQNLYIVCGLISESWSKVLVFGWVCRL